MGQFSLMAQEAAQGLDSVIPGGVAPWTGLGLLGLVMYWLLYVHLPSKDKQISEIVTTYNDRADRKDAMHNEALTESRQDFKQSLDKVVEHCAEEMEKVMARLGK